MKDYRQILETAKGMVEATKKSTGELKDACWKGFTAVGTKKKGGQTVPNCVPIKNSFEVDGDSIEEVTTEARDVARAKHNAAVLRAAGGAKAYQAQKMAKRPILDREISEFVARLSAKQIILLKKLLATGGGVQGGYQDQGGNQIGNNRGGRGYQGGNQIGND